MYMEFFCITVFDILVNSQTCVPFVRNVSDTVGFGFPPLMKYSCARHIDTYIYVYIFIYWGVDTMTSI